MVYRGKPSAGCAKCRKRKIKCDQAEPECGQCIKIGKPCPGYRNLQELQFVHQTEEVIHKSGTGASQPGPPSSSFDLDIRFRTPVSAPSSHFFDANFELQQSLGGPAYAFTVLSPSHLTSHLEDVALGYFNTHYVRPGHLHLVEGIKKGPGLSSLTEEAILSVGIAGIAHIQNSSQFLRLALHKYFSAVNLTNKALSDPNFVKLDETLVAVTLLSLFECLTCNSLQTIVGWKKHIRGCAELIKLRGQAQFQSVIGTLLFDHLRRFILLSSLWDEAPVDQEFISLTRCYASQLNRSQLGGVSVDEVGFKVSSWRYAIRKSILTDPNEIIYQGLALDAELVQWAINFPANNPASDYTIVLDVSADPKKIWKSTYHVYKDIYFAGCWSTWRALRISVNRLLSLCLAGMGKTPESPCRSRVNGIMVQMVDELCYSNPWRTGSEAVRHPDRNPRLASVIGTYTTMNPLHMAAETICEEPTASLFACAHGNVEAYLVALEQSASLVRWVVEQLRSFHHDMGIRLAGYFAAMLCTKWQTHLALEKDLLPGLLEHSEFNRLVGENILHSDDISLSDAEAFVVSSHVAQNFQRYSLFE